MDIDIAIIGGGVAGCTAAIALAKFYNVVLIDKLEQPPIRIGECLAPAARRILTQLNLLDGLEKAGLASDQRLYSKHIGTRSYWGSNNVHIVDHLRNPDGFGWHLDRQAFETYLRESALLRGVNCVWPAKLNDAQYEGRRWHLSVTALREVGMPQTYNYTTKFVIDATGRQSHFARKLGVGRQHFDKLIACWATMPNTTQNQMSTISACESGWWYSAPLPNQKRVMAFQTDSDLINGGVIRNTDQFIELARPNPEMAEIIERSLGQIELHKTTSANSTRLNQVAGQQWVALGDAATSFDPLSSQGMFNALACSVQLTELMNKVNWIHNTDPVKMREFESRYIGQIDQIWTHYLKHKALFYREERRWEDTLFWSRRQEFAKPVLQYKPELIT